MHYIWKNCSSRQRKHLTNAWYNYASSVIRKAENEGLTSSKSTQQIRLCDLIASRVFAKNKPRIRENKFGENELRAGILTCRQTFPFDVCEIFPCHAAFNRSKIITWLVAHRSASDELSTLLSDVELFHSLEAELFYCITQSDFTFTRLFKIRDVDVFKMGKSLFSYKYIKKKIEIKSNHFQ